MSMWEELMAAVGVGNAKLELQLDATVCPRDSDITGKVLLLGGQVSQQIESLIVKLEEQVQQGKSTEWKKRDSEILALWSSYPGQQIEIPFKLHVPPDARISENHAPVFIWRVSVEADIAWAVNPRAAENIQVVPHYEVTAVERALERIGFTRTGLYVDFAVRESPDTVVRYYRAPLSLRDQLDGASLHLWVFGSFLHGRIILNRSQHGIGEALKALVGGDREEHPLQFPRQALLNDKGGPNSRVAVAAFQQLLSQCLILPENVDAKTLLRPSGGPPAEANELLRPAASTGSRNPRDLLHPVESDDQDSETLDDPRN